ncbi:MAG: cyclic nucleotide-binding domain-containing protein, partial [Elusimicrobiota bacterium]
MAAKKKAAKQKISRAGVGSAKPASGLIERVRRLPFFEGLAPKELQRILPNLHWHKAPAGTVLFEEGSVGQAMYLIEQGKILISKKGRGQTNQGITILSAGEFFGEMSLFQAQLRSASAKALEETTLVTLAGKDLFGWFRRDPKTALHMMMNGIRVMAARLRETTSELTGLHSLSAALLEARTSQAVFSSATEELSKLIGPEIADGGVMYGFNPYVEEFVPESHWGAIPGELLTGLKKIPGPPHRSVPLGPKPQDGCLLIFDPKEKALLKKIPLLEIIAGAAHQALLNVQTLI